MLDKRLSIQEDGMPYKDKGKRPYKQEYKKQRGNRQESYQIKKELTVKVKTQIIQNL